MSDAPETTADLTDETELGLPVDDSPGEDTGTPEDDSPEVESVSAPEEEGEGGEVASPDEDVETLKTRMGDKDRYIRLQADERHKIAAEAAQARQEALYWQSRAQQAQQQQVQPAPDYGYNEYGQQIQQQPPTPQQPQVDPVQIAMAKTMLLNQEKEFVKAHPECATPERSALLRAKAAEIGFNLTNLTEHELAGGYLQKLEDAHKILFGHEVYQKSGADQKKRDKERKAAAAGAKVATTPTASSIGTPGGAGSKIKMSDYDPDNPNGESPTAFLRRFLAQPE